MDDGSALPLLTEVVLWECVNCTQLPPLGRLPCLKSLWISGLLGVKKVGEEFLHLGPGLGLVLGDDDEGAFPQLEFLYFERMDRWERWVPPLSTSSPSPSSSSSVVPVNKAANADAIILPRLRELWLEGCPKLEGVPPIFTTTLQKLSIWDCPMLRSLQFLPPSIQSLELCGVSTGKLLADCPTGTLPSLQHLEIIDDSELTADLLPPALQSLKIVGCKNLTTLPEGLTSLLQTLQIDECSPELSESCKVGGCLWPKIAHIPFIEIDNEEVQNNAC